MRSLVLILAIAFAGCASRLDNVQSLVSSQGWQSELVEGEGFSHRVFRNRVPPSDVLHVYIEGDGTPYLHRYFIASDPTPYNPVMLRLMALDPKPSVYVGRPCYFDAINDPRCDPAFWTLQRFSPRVVQSLAHVVKAEQARSGAKRLVLFGHSGGGTLAVLLAQRLPDVVRVVTLAPTMDIDAWTRLHDYAPLRGSLNPADGERLRDSVAVEHFVGSRDENVPPDLVTAAAKKVGGVVHVVEGFTHTCCWERIWESRVLASEAGGLSR
jgi:pimeloyl-ACP methyl ester carboxylesterase